MKCVICKRLAEYVFRGMSLCDSHQEVALAVEKGGPLVMYDQLMSLETGEIDCIGAYTMVDDQATEE